MSDWLDKARPCKLGTMPALVHVHGRDKIAIGSCVRVQEIEGGRWNRVLITAVHIGGYFKADR